MFGFKYRLLTGSSLSTLLSDASKGTAAAPQAGQADGEKPKRVSRADKQGKDHKQVTAAQQQPHATRPRDEQAIVLALLETLSVASRCYIDADGHIQNPNRRVLASIQNFGVSALGDKSQQQQQAAADEDAKSESKEHKEGKIRSTSKRAAAKQAAEAEKITEPSQAGQVDPVAQEVIRTAMNLVSNLLCSLIHRTSQIAPILKRLEAAAAQPLTSQPSALASAGVSPDSKRPAGLSISPQPSASPSLPSSPKAAASTRDTDEQSEASEQDAGAAKDSIKTDSAAKDVKEAKRGRVSKRDKDKTDKEKSEAEAAATAALTAITPEQARARCESCETICVDLSLFTPVPIKAHAALLKAAFSHGMWSEYSALHKAISPRFESERPSNDQLDNLEAEAEADEQRIAFSVAVDEASLLQLLFKLEKEV